MSGADVHAVDTEVDELTVTFNPPLYLQRRAWIFEVMRRERVVSVRNLCIYHCIVLKAKIMYVYVVVVHYRRLT